MMDTTVINAGDNTITGIKVDLARLEGMLAAFLTDGVRRIESGERATEKLRSDLTAVKEECHKDLAAVATLVTVNVENIKELRTDIKDIRDKQNASFGRILLIVSPIISGAALLWNMLGK
jgi:hypothetical protein